METATKLNGVLVLGEITFLSLFQKTKPRADVPSPMVGNNALAISVDFAHYARRWGLQSEGTINATGATAFAAFLRYQLTASDILLLQLRHFSGHNIAPSARTFQQGSKVQNEMGLLFGYETARWRKLRWQSFAQIYHHPLPTLA